jgi:hypothetical protein
MLKMRVRWTDVCAVVSRFEGQPSSDPRRELGLAAGLTRGARGSLERCTLVFEICGHSRTGACALVGSTAADRPENPVSTALAFVRDRRPSVLRM